MVHVVPADLAAGQYVVLTAIYDVQAHSQRLHHGRSRAAQIVRSPLAVLAAGKDKGIVIASVLQWPPILELHLAVADLL